MAAGVLVPMPWSRSVFCGEYKGSKEDLNDQRERVGLPRVVPPPKARRRRNDDVDDDVVNDGGDGFWVHEDGNTAMT